MASTENLREKTLKGEQVTLVCNAVAGTVQGELPIETDILKPGQDPETAKTIEWLLVSTFKLSTCSKCERFKNRVQDEISCTGPVIDGSSESKNIVVNAKLNEGDPFQLAEIQKAISGANDPLSPCGAVFQFNNESPFHLA